MMTNQFTVGGVLKLKKFLEFDNIIKIQKLLDLKRITVQHKNILTTASELHKITKIGLKKKICLQVEKRVN